MFSRSSSPTTIAAAAGSETTWLARSSRRWVRHLDDLRRLKTIAVEADIRDVVLKVFPGIINAEQQVDEDHRQVLMAVVQKNVALLAKSLASALRPTEPAGR